MEAMTVNGIKCLEVDLDRIDPGITDWDQEAYRAIISTELTPEQVERIVTPPETYPRQETVLAVHWHPEFVPMELILRRLDRLYPNRRHELIIPTQHNVLMGLNGYAGVEVDCYSRGFNRKVQLLLHFEESRLARADSLRSMLSHTFQYRASQLFDFLDAVVNPDREETLQAASRETGASEELVGFVRLHARKLLVLIETNQGITPGDAIKNKLVRNYFDRLRDLYNDRLIQRAQVLLNEVKSRVKDNFSLSYFYRTSEIIEEARGLGAGIVVPHPEQFWPILLADYDVDGYEVWNPQSREYTEFLINSVNRQNKTRRGSSRELLVFMGDDTHMSEKVKEPGHQDKAKAAREIGLQPAWDDLAIKKSLIVASLSRRRLIEEYQARLAG